MQNKSLFKCIAFLSIFALGGCDILAEPKRFAICYHQLDGVSGLHDYDVLVFDAHDHPDFSSLAPEKTILGYVNLGEADEGVLSDDQQHFVVGFNEVWNSSIIDVRYEGWHDKILQDVAALKKKGFDGIMIDTVDSLIYLEQTQPEKFKGTNAATVRLIAKIKATFPDMKIMLNRGFEIWQDVAPHVDMMLAESTLSDHNFDTGESYLRKEGEYDMRLRQIRTIKDQYEHLEIYSVDYWDMNDAEGVTMLYKVQRGNGLIPYVATPELNKIYSEPEISLWQKVVNHPVFSGGSNA